MNRQKRMIILEKAINDKKNLMVEFADDTETTRLILFEVYGMLDLVYQIGDITIKGHEYRTNDIDQFWEQL